MAAKAPITHFDLDPDRRAVIAESTQDYGIGEEDSGEWPNNVLSNRTVVYGSGRIARTGDEVLHAVDPDELELCRELSSGVAALVAGMAVGMSSEGGEHFQGFFIAGNVGESVPKGITEAMVRERFGGTIFPPAMVTVEPLVEQGVWWSEVEWDGQGSPVEYFVPWRRMIDWFKGRSEFLDMAFVRIGNQDSMNAVPEEEFPDGTHMPGCVFPRLALGLTVGGSLVGLFGVCVQT